MPGHFTNDKTAADIIALEELIKSHDAIFLLTDSRESRWLPTVLGNFHNKIVITSALGFDSFLVMRHGGQLGCYFCNDVVAPTDSMTDRTLDQQCTVTRPGLSSIAAGTTVELLASILNHPLGYSLLKRLEAQTNSESFFGTVPHQIRGQLGTFSTLLLNGSRYDQCTACSPVIAKHYREQGIPFIIKGMQSPEYIEEVTGLTKLKQESENVEFEWSDDSSSS